MLPKLSESSKLKDEIRYFESKLKIMSDKDKIFVKERIVSIKKLSGDIDRAHDINHGGFLTPNLITNTRQELNSARNDIYKKISYYT